MKSIAKKKLSISQSRYLCKKRELQFFVLIFSELSKQQHLFKDKSILWKFQRNFQTRFRLTMVTIIILSNNSDLSTPMPKWT